MGTPHSERSLKGALVRGAMGLATIVIVVGGCAGDDDGDDTLTNPTADTSDAEALKCATPASGEPVRVGVLWPEGSTVHLPELGDAAVAAAGYASDCLGGIGGRPVEVVDCQIDETNPATATACANEMVESDVAAVVVTVTAQGESLVPIITDAGIPYIVSGGASGPENVDQTGLVFGVSGGAASSLGAMAQVAADEGMDKVILLVSDNAAAAVGGLAGIPFGAVGVEVEVIPVPAGTADATPQLSAALADGADATALIGDGTLCISYLQAASAVDPDGTHWVISTCTAASVIEAAGADAVEGVTVFTTSTSDTDDDEAALYRSVMAEYAPDTSTTGFTVTGYVAMLSLIRGVDGLVGEVTPASIAAAMANTSGVPLPAGAGASFGCATDPIALLNAVCSADGVVGTVDNGRLSDVRLVDTAPLFAG